MKQDKTLWLKQVDKEALHYHERQFQTPYRSTVFFCEFLESLGLISPKDSINILDMGSGEGANINYMAGKYPKSAFIGLDVNKNLVKKGNQLFKKLEQKRCLLETGDLYKLNKKYKSVFDGVISLQTLSWLPSYQKPILEMVKLNPKWIAISSLFYDGFIDCEIKVKDYEKSKGKKSEDAYYNVYSLKLVEEFFKKNGYKKFKFKQFIIDVDIDKNKRGKMGTYTVKKMDGARLQISGPLLMNWYFIVAEK